MACLGWQRKPNLSLCPTILRGTHVPSDLAQRTPPNCATDGAGGLVPGDRPRTLKSSCLAGRGCIGLFGASILSLRGGLGNLRIDTVSGYCWA